MVLEKKKKEKKMWKHGKVNAGWWSCAMRSICWICFCVLGKENEQVTIAVLEKVKLLATQSFSEVLAWTGL